MKKRFLSYPALPSTSSYDPQARTPDPEQQENLQNELPSSSDNELNAKFDGKGSQQETGKEKDDNLTLGEKLILKKLTGKLFAQLKR